MSNSERLVDEMALALLAVPELGSDQDCILALFFEGFRPKDIFAHLDEARKLARQVRLFECDIWARLAAI